MGMGIARDGDRDRGNSPLTSATANAWPSHALSCAKGRGGQYLGRARVPNHGHPPRTGKTGGTLQCSAGARANQTKQPSAAVEISVAQAFPQIGTCPVLGLSLGLVRLCAVSVLGAGDIKAASGLWTCCRRSCFLGFLVLLSSLCFAQLFRTSAACLFRPTVPGGSWEIVSATTFYSARCVSRLPW
ncbi:hypothetical protein GE21DRAFT_1004394 [Neurospora crassa]|nr:hypothetical protein GE21DRAFT_1004394 [Neurospora crassa]